MSSLLTIFDFTYRPMVWLSLGPALLNVGLLVYAWRRLAKHAVTWMFLLFVSMLIALQLTDAFSAIGQTAIAANFWSTLFNFSWLAPAVGLHFAVFYTKHDRLAMSPWFIVPVYGISLLFQHALGTYFLVGNIAEFTLSPWGWVRISSPHQGFYGLYALWLFALLFGMLGTLVFYAITHWRKRAERISALLLVVGLLAPVVVSLAASTIVLLMGKSQVPLTALMITLFTICALLAMLRYEFLLDIPAIAAPAIIETMADFLLVADTKGHIILTNPATVKALGYAEDEILGKHISTFLPLDDELLQILYRINSLSEVVQQEKTTIKARHQKLPISFSVALIRQNAETVIGVAAVCHPIERMEKHVELLQEQEEKMESMNAELLRRVQELEHAAGGRHGNRNKG